MIERSLPASSALAILVISGCMQGRLTIDGARPDGGSRSGRENRTVHVGEEVEFTFALFDALRRNPVSVIRESDYGVARIGNRWVEMKSDTSGRYRFSGRIEPAWLEAGSVVVSATACRVRGRRDLVISAGRFIRSQSPYDEPDITVAGDTLRLRVYQSVIRLNLPDRKEAYDWETARLTIERADGRTCSVLVDRPPRRGFQIENRGEGGCSIWYRPRIDQINRAGSTQVRLTVHRADGARYARSATVPTP